MKSTFLQVVFSFFLGLVVVAFVGIGVNTFYPAPIVSDTNPDTGPANHWRLITSVILVGLAIVVMGLSLIRSEHRMVISNGLLLGGLFTMAYGVGMTMSAQNSWTRLLVVGLALAVTIGLGWLKFVVGREAVPARVSAGAPADTTDLAARVTAVEAKLDAIARALHNS